jgi:hypothetical protein
MHVFLLIMPRINPIFKFIACCLPGLLCCLPASAHVIVGELEKLSTAHAALVYLRLGYQHILPLGLDHIFFILTLYLLSPRLKVVLWQATAFTVAHSVTLGLAMYHLISPPARIVEPLIAATILFAALENIYSAKLRPSRIALVFLFGLIHGMGFAGALGQLGLPPNAYLLSLLMFNLGVELGQLTIILSAFFLFGKWFGEKTWYRPRIVIPLSATIAVIAAWWTIQRLFF